MRFGRRTPVRQVTLVTRAGCHLCDQAHDVVRRVCGEVGTALHVVDVDGPLGDLAPQAAAGAWTEKVPVVLLDGREWAWWRVDEGPLRTALRRGVRTS